MSSKKRKSTGQFWFICDICKSVLHVKDTSVHKTNSCHVHNNGLLHSYIKNEILYTKIDTASFEDISSLKEVPVENQNSFVLLSVNAMQLLKVPMGDAVVIHPSDQSSVPFVKFAWPNSEKNLSAYLTKEVISTNSLNSPNGVAINVLTQKLQVAKQIRIKCESSFEISNEADFLMTLRDEKLKNIYCIGNKLTYKYYGKLLVFEIIDIKPFENSSNMESDCEDSASNNFFIVTYETSFIINDSAMIDSEGTQLKKIGGIDDIVEELDEIISITLFNDNLLPGIQTTRGVLIFGPSGTGKTTLVETMAQRHNVNFIKIETSQIFSKYIGEAERQLLKHFDKAKQLSPSIILIDDLDIICPKMDEKNDHEKRIITTLSYILDKLHNSNTQPVLVFATTSRIGDIHKSLRRAGRFGKEIEIYVPNSIQRKDILCICMENMKHNLSDDDIKSIADLSHGFVGADLVSLVSKAALRHFKTNSDNVISVSDFHWALTKVKPSAMREVLIDVPNVNWSDIGGQEDLKLKLRQAVEWPLKFEDSFKRLGIVPPRRLLMFGPPGCSKTMIAKALATESKLNFISVKGPELFSKWVGDSEKAVREVFRRARQVAPSIVFFDELDAIGGGRDTDSSGSANVEERVLAQLLTELDGVEPLGDVTIVGATNRPDKIDPALLRPGRFDRIVYVPLPDANTRKQILAIQFKKTPVNEDVLIDELVKRTEGYSGAEIVAVCHEAALKAIEENFNSDNVQWKHFLGALNMVLPRTSPSLLKIYEDYLNK